MTNDDENMFAAEQHKALSRRRFLTGSVRTLGAALASAGIYELIDVIVQPPERAAFAAAHPNYRFARNTEPFINAVESFLGTLCNVQFGKAAAK